MAEEKRFEVPYTLKLEFPLTFGSETISELRFEKRPTARNFKGIPATGLSFDHMFTLLSRATGQPLSVIEKLDVSDMYHAVEVVNSFLPSGLQTGQAQ